MTGRKTKLIKKQKTGNAVMTLKAALKVMTTKAAIYIYIYININISATVPLGTPGRV
jgi:hypothetical protein